MIEIAITLMLVLLPLNKIEIWNIALHLTAVLGISERKVHLQSKLLKLEPPLVIVIYSVVKKQLKVSKFRAVVHEYK